MNFQDNWCTSSLCLCNNFTQPAELIMHSSDTKLYSFHDPQLHMHRVAQPADVAQCHELLKLWAAAHVISVTSPELAPARTALLQRAAHGHIGFSFDDRHAALSDVMKHGTKAFLLCLAFCSTECLPTQPRGSGRCTTYSKAEWYC